MNDQDHSHKDHRHTRLRYTATGALAALAAVGAIAGATALGAKSPANAHAQLAAAKRGAIADHGADKTATSPRPDKTQTPPSPANQQPFFNAVQQLVASGTITGTQGRALDHEIQSGRIDTDTLTGFTTAQLQAVQQALANAKRALAPAVTGGPRTPKEPPPAGAGAPSGG